ncbi:MAG: hypothetical protein VB140_02495 [Burkholderia sp.]
MRVNVNGSRSIYATTPLECHSVFRLNLKITNCGSICKNARPNLQLRMEHRQFF